MNSKDSVNSSCTIYEDTNEILMEYKKIIMAELLRAGVRDIDHIVVFSNALADKMSK